MYQNKGDKVVFCDQIEVAQSQELAQVNSALLWALVVRIATANKWKRGILFSDTGMVRSVSSTKKNKRMHTHTHTEAHHLHMWRKRSFFKWTWTGHVFILVHALWPTSILNPRLGWGNSQQLWPGNSFKLTIKENRHLLGAWLSPWRKKVSVFSGEGKSHVHVMGPLWVGIQLEPPPPLAKMWTTFPGWSDFSLQRRQGAVPFMRYGCSEEDVSSMLDFMEDVVNVVVFCSDANKVIGQVINLSQCAIDQCQTHLGFCF